MKLPPPHRVLPRSTHWPSALDDLDDPPASFDCVGVLDDAPRVGIVGTRRADASANRFAHRLARELAERGITIVSGGALGIDASAHRGALETTAGRTIAVLASGFARPYPRSHGPLFEQIAERGALIHEDHPAQSKSRFLFRNRLIAALSDVVVVVQAPRKSGALSTAYHALAMNRPLLVVPVAPWDKRGEGNLTLLDRPEATLCTSSARVLEALGMSSPKKRTKKTKTTKKKQAKNASSALYELLSAEPQSLDALAEASGRAVAELNLELLRLLLAGEALETPQGWIAT